MTTTPDAQGLVEQFDPAALALAATAPEPAVQELQATIKPSNRKSILVLSLCALAINGSAAIYSLPSDFSSLQIGSLAEMLPRLETSAPKPDPVLVALKEIQSTQQQHTASLLENNRVLQQSAALTQQDSTVLLSLRQSITDERVDVKKVSSQLSSLIAKVDSLQSAMVSDVTSSIRRANARYGLSAAIRKRMSRQSKSVGPVSIGGAPLSVPATASAPES
jgi:hypothetical protein